MADGKDSPAGTPDQLILDKGVETSSVVWDDSKMTTSFANVVNGTSTREEVTLFFGTNRTWNLKDTKELKVELSDRIILTPYAGKRLWLLLGSILEQYERRFGELSLDNAPSPQRRKD